MFEQNPVLGPGTGATTTHTLEILIMLAVAFLLGLWLGWLLWNRFKAIYDQLLTEHEATKSQLEASNNSLDAAQKRIQQFETDHAAFRSRIDSLTADYHDSEARFQQLNSQLSRVSEKAASLEAELNDLRPAEIPMEVIESPVDVHVESLVEDLPPAEAENLVVEAPEIEPMVDAEETPDEEIPASEPVAIAPAVVEEPVEVAPTVAAEPIPIVPVAVSEPVETKVYANKPVVVERVIVHQPYVEPVAEAAEESSPAAKVELSEKSEETPVSAPVFSFTPSTSADDLRIVEGIGPKIEQVLNENGIFTFRQLSETSEERLREILAAAGNRYKMHDPGTWAEQARLADAGDWETLKNWQDVLKAGREKSGADAGYGENELQIVENQSVTAEPVEIEAPKNGIYSEPEIFPTNIPNDVPEVPTAPDDLKVIEGIGPKIEELLVKNGISTFSTLAATPVAQLKEILDAAGSRFAIHDPGTWPAQSLLAANGEWENLKAYQGFLNAGKRPE